MNHAYLPYQQLPTPPTTPLSFAPKPATAFAPGYHSGPYASVRAPLTPPPTLYIPRCPEARLGETIGGRLCLVEILGSGAYGTVYLAVDRQTGVKVAVKTLNKFNDDGTRKDQRNMDFQTREIRLHWAASLHENVVSMLNIIDEQDCIHVVLEYCPQGDLFQNIVNRGLYDGQDELIRRTFLQILEAVKYCHSQGIYHRDLKPENILITDQGDVKLADFGLASSNPISEDYGCGSEFYMSPECLDRTAQRTSYLCAPNDVWSLGVILVNLACRRNPWRFASTEDASYRAFVQNPGFLMEILPISAHLNEILRRIFTYDPAQRITLPELIQAVRACPSFTNQPVYFQAQPTKVYNSPSPTSPESVDSDDSDDAESVSDNESMSRSSSLDGIAPEDRPVSPEEKPAQPVTAPQAPYAFHEQPVMETYAPQPQCPRQQYVGYPSPPTTPPLDPPMIPAQQTACGHFTKFFQYLVPGPQLLPTTHHPFRQQAPMSFTSLYF